MKRLLLIVFASAVTTFSFTQALVSQFSKTVAFLYVAGTTDFIPTGTGFLISIPAKTKDKMYVYLVTAKHVLITPDKKQLDAISIRFNTKDSSKMFEVPLIWSGLKKTVYLHSDPSVDLAVIPIVVPPNIDYKHIDVNQIITRKDYDSLNVSVGTEVFFTGLFTPYTGTKKISPIFRFGRVCLIPNEKFDFDGTERSLLFIESSSFGGNSGSPVIFQYKKGNTTFVGLGGVVLGSFTQGQSLGKINNKDVVAWNSMGISAITPSEFILDILNSAELNSLRTK